MHKAYLLLGSNLGDRMKHLECAAAIISRAIGRVTAHSSIYESEPWGKKDQPAFLNQALAVDTGLSPAVLLNEILEAEKEMGRERKEKWGERIIDIDILFYDSDVIRSDKLSVPHPFLHERRFTLLPLNEIAQGLLHPVLHKTIAQLLKDCPDTGKAGIYRG